MARTFDGTDDEVVCSTGALSSLTGANVTVVAVMRRNVNSAWHGIWSMNDSVDGYSGWGLLLTDTGKPYIQNDGAGPSSMSVTTSDGWVVIGYSKAAGTATARFHKYGYAANSWSHVNGDATQADGSAGGASGKAKFGTYNGGADRLNGDIVMAGVWNSVLTDTQIETLAHSLQAWYSLAPSALWMLDQSFVTIAGSFPTASGAVTSNSAGNTTTYNAPIPDSLAAGDRVVIGVVKDGTGTLTWPGSPAWSTLTNGAQTSDSHHMEIRYRDIDGTEGWSGTGNTIAVTGASEGYASYAVKVAAGTFDAATAPASDGAFTSANSAAPNPPSVNPSWGSANTLWIVLYGWDGNVAHSAYPANYTSNQATDRWANTGGSGIAGATREATAVPEDPGTATLGTADEWAAFTVGIKPIIRTHVVNDLTGGGANQTAITGTSVSTNSAPIGYGFEVAVPHGHVEAGTNAPAEAASATGTAEAPTRTVSTGSQASSGTGTANNPSPSVRASSGAAEGTGTANNATIQTTGGTNAQAEVATATGTAETPTRTVSSAIGSAAATGTGQDATAKVSPTPTTATGTGTANNATVQTGSFVNAQAGVATGTGTANEPTRTASSGIQAAEATGTANNATVTVGTAAQAEVATATGVANGATVAVGRTASAEVAIAVGAVSGAALSIRAGAEAATALAVALDALITGGDVPASSLATVSAAVISTSSVTARETATSTATAATQSTSTVTEG
ncbi:MAG TPA: hypothetical protein VFR23_18115 [Jiangellaceae bacterium]|nr:hypothetical protein [Jiangellaceae bacterium]